MALRNHSRRRRGQPTSLVLPEELKDWIESEATRLGIPRTNVIIMCIKRFKDYADTSVPKK